MTWPELLAVALISLGFWLLVGYGLSRDRRRL